MCIKNLRHKTKKIRPIKSNEVQLTLKNLSKEQRVQIKRIENLMISKFVKKNQSESTKERKCLKIQWQVTHQRVIKQQLIKNQILYNTQDKNRDAKNKIKKKQKNRIIPNLLRWEKMMESRNRYYLSRHLLHLHPQNRIQTIRHTLTLI